MAALMIVMATADKQPFKSSRGHQEKMKAILNNSVLNFIFFSYALNATWEWTQSPFFIDTTSSLNLIVWYRIHCSLGDTIILLVGFALLSLNRKSIAWIRNPKVSDYLVLCLLGVSYTFFSEYINVYVRHSWSYSEYMPLMPLIPVGIIPLVQWVALPPVIVFITKRQIRP